MLKNTIMLFIGFIVLGTYQANTSFILRTKYFKFEKSKRFVNTVNLISSKIVASKGVCTTKCTMEEDCCAASFDSENGMCRLTQDCVTEVESFSSSIVIKLNTGECRRSAVGYSYLGRVNRTVNNRQCQRWGVDTPHNQSILDRKLYSAGNLEENYCRNPDIWDQGPWCYTLDTLRFERCDIPFCEGPPKECLESPKGVEYFGHISESYTGRVCQRWDVQFYSYYEVYYLVDQENYCRNPYGMREKPWCYVGSWFEWEYCTIPIC